MSTIKKNTQMRLRIHKAMADKNRRERERIINKAVEDELKKGAEERALRRQRDDARLAEIDAMIIPSKDVDHHIDGLSISELEDIWNQKELRLTTKACCAKVLSLIRHLKKIDKIAVPFEQLLSFDSIKSLDLDDGFIPEIISNTTVSTKTKRIAEITARTHQSEFRDMLLKAYGACAVTGSKLVQILEAAHVIPFNGQNDTLCNGIILRSDIHKLFDKYMLTINPESRELELNPLIYDEYKQYKKKINTTASNDSLTWHYRQFRILL